ncbi:ATP synthase subunit H [Necator americanus]|uniref:V-type proton ATPase subunit n=3 Tax=Ancylostomatidae TaxID=33278 RepID=W2T4V5_NECAM|nr:ATP synthase subunit H [Necator americanus]ETN76918.1 ATP synthase subunit H [Necator americanus]
MLPFSKDEMGVVIPLVSVTAFWLLIGVGGPFLVPKGPNRGIIQTMIIMTAVCCHLFWIMIYLHQLNPLIGPQINVKTIRWISLKWGDSPTPVPLGQ